MSNSNDSFSERLLKALAKVNHALSPDERHTLSDFLEHPYDFDDQISENEQLTESPA
jgi:hypothetical protein